MVSRLRKCQVCSIRSSNLLAIVLSIAVLIIGCILLINDSEPSEAEIYSGSCGDNVTYTFNTETGTLTISGAGEMHSTPWYSYRDSIKSVKIEDSITTIGNWAFSGCTSLTSVTIGNSVTTIGFYAFSGCTSLTSVTIPDSVTAIGDCTFNSCTSLTSVTIPDSVTTIEIAPFMGCSELTSISVEADNSHYCSIEGVLFNKEKTQLIQYPCGKVNDSYVIPSSVATIGVGAFSGCTLLASVTIPNSVTSIRLSAFYGCTSLNSMIIPDSVETIGENAFEGCISLTSIIISNSVTSIEKNAFYGITFYDTNGINELEKNADSLAGYKFEGTNAKLIKVGSAPIISFFDITFIFPDDTSLIKSYTQGSNITEPTYQYRTGYTLIWTKDGTEFTFPFIMPAYNFELKAEWKVNEYTITFKNWNGNVLSSNVYDYGTPASQIIIPTATRGADSKYTYTFKGWDNPLSDVVENTTYTAQFTAISKQASPAYYTITFKNWDGTVLYTSSYSYGSNVTYDGATPTRSSDDMWTYVFSGWDRPISSVTGDATYTAQFTATAKQPTSSQFTIVFKNWDGTTLSSQEYDSGTAASQIVIPTATRDEDSQFTYTFQGWSPQISDATADAEYTAVFSKMVKVDQKTDGSYSVDIAETSATFTAETIAEIVEKAKNDNTTTMTITLEEGVIKFDNSALQSFGSVDTELILSKLAKDRMSIDVSKIVGDNVAYDITFGDNRTFGNGKVTVSVAYALDDGRDADRLIVYYIVDGKVAEEIPCLYDDGYVTFVTDHLSTYAIMYIEPESDARFPIMYVAIGIVAVLIVVVGALFLLKKRA